MLRMSRLASTSRPSETYEVRHHYLGANDTDKFQDAIRLLNSRRRQRRPKTLPVSDVATYQMPGNPTFKGIPSLANMKQWLYLLGYSVIELLSISSIKQPDGNRMFTLKA